MIQAKPFISASHVSYSAPDGRMLVRDISFEVDAGILLMISGPNGIGKSTLLQVILGMCPLNSGKVHLNIKKNKIFYLPQLQNRAFHIPLTLGDILSFSERPKSPHSWELLEDAELSLPWNGASGGERQKTLLTLGLQENPSLLILDEPTNHLDKSSRKKLNQALQIFLNSGQHAIIMVSHEADMTFSDAVSVQHLELGQGGTKC